MVSKEFSENVQAGDVVTVRNTLVEYLIIDRTFSTFDEALRYAALALPVVEEHDGKEFELDPQKWDMRYLNVQKAALRFNFSQPRIDHLKSVIKTVMPVESTNQGVNSSSEKRTGRVQVEVKEIDLRAKGSTAYKQQSQPVQGTGSNKKTGTRIVSETEYPADDSRRQNSSKRFDASSALIVGGVAVAAVGVATVEPIVIGAGVVIAGAGCAVKVSSRK